MIGLADNAASVSAAVVVRAVCVEIVFSGEFRWACGDIEACA